MNPCVLALLAAAFSMSAFGGGKLEAIPFYFEQNVGQTDSRVRFLVRGGGLTLLLTDSETVLSTGGRRATVRMKFEGSNRPFRLEGIDPQPGVSNYYHGSDPAKWRTGVPHYARVVAKQVYEGIDAVYYASDRRIEYDFVVSPGADPHRIRLAYEGADTVRVDETGDLVLTTSARDLRQHKPRVYQEISGRRIDVAARYRVRGSKVEFELARYDHAFPLVIDPVLSYGSFLGGSGDDKPAGIGLDSAGNIYVGGHTESPDFPKANAADSTYNFAEAFITKLTPDGKSLVFSTYFGGSQGDSVQGFAVHGSGASYVAGTTDSPDLPTTPGVVGPALMNPNGPYSDAFVARFTSTGTLSFATYLGGFAHDGAKGVAVDAAGNGYVAGYTESQDFPGVVSMVFSEDVFVAKFSPTGNMVFSRVYGGFGTDVPFSIAADSTGAYVTGETGATSFPIVGGVQTALRGDMDAFVMKVRPDGSGLAYSTFLGGTGWDRGRVIAVDPAGNAYVAGYATEGFPMVAPLLSTRASNFVAKLNAAGNALLYSTYFGAPPSSGGSEVTAIAVDASGRVILGGSSHSLEFPTYAALYSANPGGFVTKLNAAGNGYVYSTFHDGASEDAPTAIWADSSGAAWITGYTTNLGPTYVPVVGGYDLTPNPLVDGYIAKYEDGPPPVTITVTSSPVGRQVVVDGRTVTTPATFAWQPGTTHTLQVFAQVTDFIRYTWQSWSQGGGALQSVVAPSSAQTYIASFSSAPCTVSFGSSEISFPIAGGNQSVPFTTQEGCNYPLPTTPGWIIGTSIIGFQGQWTFGVAVEPNTGPPRTTDINVGGAILRVRQLGSGASLAAPAIAAPAASQVFTTRGVPFSWSSVAGATGYDILISSTSSGSFVAVFRGNQTGNSATSTIVDLLTGHYLFWVRACSGAYTDATCGPFATVPATVALEYPTLAPVIESPTPGQVFTSSTQEFRWQPVAGATRYQVTLISTTGTEMQINTSLTSTIYSMKGGRYRLVVQGCIAACGSASEVSFDTNLPQAPASAPAAPSATALSGNSFRFNWNAVTGADIYRVAVVQANTGPGGGALTVASGQTAVTQLTMTVPVGQASVIVAACNGRGCGPYSAPTPINPSGPSPSAPILGQPISVVNVDGPMVLFTWSRVPGDNGSNTLYRLYSADLSRNATALDVQTTNNFHAGLFAAEGRRYDAVVAANPGPSQTVGPAVGFIVQGTSAPSPTPVAPTHEGSVKQGNVLVGWTPVPLSAFYQFAVYRLGDPSPTSTGITPGLLTVAPLVGHGAGTRYSVIVRACHFSNINVCKPDSDAGWGPWSNAPGGPGVANFTVTP